MNFGSGTKHSLNYVGTNYKQGLLKDGEPLGKDYSRSDILLYSPGKINMFLAKTIEDIKKSINQEDISWKIADLGCCSSSVFSQARLFVQAMDLEKANYDSIVNIDGNKGFLKSAKNYLTSKEWIETINKIDHSKLNSQDLETIKKSLGSNDYMNAISFLNANFTSDPLGNNYDAIIASQCLQYNDQANNRDIEKIIMNVNKSLKDNGHLLIALTGNSYEKSFTKKQDVDNLIMLLDNYGFEVKKYVHLQGKIVTGLFPAISLNPSCVQPHWLTRASIFPASILA